MADLSKAYGRGFDAERRVYLGAAAKLVLLKVNGKTRPFDIVETITTGWTAKFKEFFSVSVFQIADITAPTASKIRNASHVMVIDSSKLPALNNVVFEGDGKAQPPLGENPYWSYTATSRKEQYFPAEQQEV